MVVWATGGWDWLDPLVSIAIAAMISWQAIRLLASAADVMLQTAPRHLDLDAVRSDLSRVADVVDVHDLHVWTLAEDMVVATAHLMVRSGADMHGVLDRAQEVLHERYGLDHATLQVEPDDHSGCEKLTW
jgi:cobalt-zinc-cadmium efflux system protein